MLHSTRSRKAGLFLLAILQATPIVALAGLASRDVTGTPRFAPLTMGALEISTVTGDLPAPTGLRVDVIPNIV